MHHRSIESSAVPSGRSSVFESLQLWLDDTPRSGANNMAIDQMLIEQVGEVAVLRVYRWSEPTVSFGYFMSLSAAQREFSDESLHYVRRWTGGGIVDHRDDITYTLVIPKSHPLAMARGSESYRLIHQFLAESLIALGQQVQVFEKPADACEGGCACFTNPVEHDLQAESGQKIAGAGQKRTRYGLLHQGSVNLQPQKQGHTEDAEGDRQQDGFRKDLLHALGSQLSESVESLEPSEGFLREAKQLASQRYASEEWLGKKK